MTEKFIRHFVSAIGMLICLLAFLAGYRAGQMGWWFAGIMVIVVYIGIYKLMEM